MMKHTTTSITVALAFGAISMWPRAAVAEEPVAGSSATHPALVSRYDFEQRVDDLMGRAKAAASETERAEFVDPTRHGDTTRPGSVPTGPLTYVWDSVEGKFALRCIANTATLHIPWPVVDGGDWTEAFYFKFVGDCWDNTDGFWRIRLDDWGTNAPGGPAVQLAIGTGNSARGVKPPPAVSQNILALNLGGNTPEAIWQNLGDVNIKEKLWNHYAFTYEAKTRRLAFFFNGLPKWSAVLDKPLERSQARVLLAGGGSGAHAYFDEYRIYQAALSAEELVREFPSIGELSDPPLGKMVTNLFNEQNLVPPGERYEATVPDTLDLAERARLLGDGMLNCLNMERGGMPYLGAYFMQQPATMWHGGGLGGQNWGQYIDGITMMRLMSGSQYGLDMQAKSLNTMLELTSHRGIYFFDTWLHVSGMPDNFFTVTSGRMLLSLMSLHDMNPRPEVASLVRKVGEAYMGLATVRPDMAWYAASDDPAYTHSMPILNGTAMVVLDRYHGWSGDPKPVKINEGIRNYSLQSKFWTPEASPATVVPEEHGHFQGHIHSYMQALEGMLAHGVRTDDMKIKLLVRDAYEFNRNFGISRIGLLGEMCATSDMTLLAINLSKAGIGDYWDDADQYLRNSIADRQITDPDYFKSVNAQMPQKPAPTDLKDWTHDRVIERNFGMMLSGNGNPVLNTPEHNFKWSVCCSFNMTRAIYAAWRSTVQFHDGHAQINLLLNRAAQSVDVESHLPYEGKVVVRNKTAQRISVRIPGWVKLDSVRAEIGAGPAKPFFTGRYAVFEQVKPGDVLTLMFPVENRSESYVLRWLATDHWEEHNGKPPGWKNPNAVTYKFTLRGNEVVDVTPRHEDMPGYRCYRRDYLKGDKAPLHKVSRFVPREDVTWW